MITELTREQVAKFPAYIKEWTDYGVCTEHADRQRAESAIATMYAIAGKNPPHIIWCGSPFSMVLTKTLMPKVRASVGASVWASVGASVRDSVWASVRDSVGDSVWASVGASVWDSVWDSVWASVGASVRDSVRDSVFGQHEAAWLAFYHFFRDECGLTKETAKLRGLWELCQSCGWIMPYENVCFASERHDVCELDGSGVIHCEDGPAIHYPDGFSVHAWHGTRVPAEWIEARGTLSASAVLSHENTEVRRSGCEILGWDRIIDQLGGMVISADADPQIGTLIEVNLPDNGPARFLRVQCGTGRTFALCVPNHVTTPIEAQAALHGMSVEDFTPPTLRT